MQCGWRTPRSRHFRAAAILFYSHCLIAFLFLGAQLCSVTHTAAACTGRPNNASSGQTSCGSEADYLQPWLSIRNALVRHGVGTFEVCTGTLPILSAFGNLGSTSSLQSTPLSELQAVAREIQLELSRSVTDNGDICGGAQTGPNKVNAPESNTKSNSSTAAGEKQRSSDGEQSRDVDYCSFLETAMDGLSNMSSPSVRANPYGLEAMVLRGLALLADGLSAKMPSNQSRYHLRCPAGTSWCFDIVRLCAQINKLSRAVASVEDALSVETLRDVSSMAAFYQPIISSALADSGFDGGLEVERSAGLEFLFNVCNFLFPACTTSAKLPEGKFSRIPTCSMYCEKLRTILFIMVKLTSPNSESIGIMALRQLHKYLQSTCAAVAGEACVTAAWGGFSEGTTKVIGRNVSVESHAVSSPLSPHLPCPFPLIETNVSSHYLPEVRSLIRRTLINEFNITVPLGDDVIDQLFPCGMKCVTPGHSDDAHNRVKTTAAVVAWLVLLASASSCFFYIFKLKGEKKPVHQRLVFAFNITFAAMAISLVPATFSSSKKFICFADGTLRRGEPSTSILCSLFGAVSYAALIQTSSLLACLSHQWLDIINKLRRGAFVQREMRSDRRRFRLYMVFSCGPTIVLTIVVLGLQEINGSPLTGTCGVGFKHLFFLLTVPLLFCGGLAVVMLACGFGNLWLLWRKTVRNENDIKEVYSSDGLKTTNQSKQRGTCLVGPIQMWLAGRYSGEGLTSAVTLKSVSQLASNTKALQRLLVNLFVCIVSVATMAFVNVAFGGIVYTRDGEWKTGTLKSAACESFHQLLGSRQTASNCPPVPKIEESVIVALLIVFAGAGVILSISTLANDVRVKTLKRSQASSWRSTRRTLVSAEGVSDRKMHRNESQYSVQTPRPSPLATQRPLSNFTQQLSPEVFSHQTTISTPQTVETHDWHGCLLLVSPPSGCQDVPPLHQTPAPSVPGQTMELSPVEAPNLNPLTDDRIVDLSHSPGEFRRNHSHLGQRQSSKATMELSPVESPNVNLLTDDQVVDLSHSRGESHSKQSHSGQRQSSKALLLGASVEMVTTV